MSGFSLNYEKPIKSLGVKLQSYVHDGTGATHYHFASNDEENVFMVAFRTIPQDSTGVAHILEHTVLCGSKRYPVRDPFFLMIRRSLSTFMNAFTASDWTAYPFATCNKKDFNNLLSVYLDAVFFPNLNHYDFAQEGWRYCFEKTDDANSDLIYKGIVFNEMKGAMSTQTRALWQQLSEEIYPNTTYHFNSGGAPENIPDLSYEALKAFHKKYYHPTNAIFLTYGDQSASALQSQFEDKVLSQFTASKAVPLVTLEQPFKAPKEIHREYPLDEADLTGRTHVVLSWLWGENTDIDQLLQAHLLTGVLLDNGASPLLKALEQTDLGQAPSPLCGLEDEQRQMQFTAGLEGSEKANAEAVKNLILSTLKDIVRDGIDPVLVESVLHQLELEQRDMERGTYPYGLSLILSALTPVIHGGEISTRVDIDQALTRLRAVAKDDRFIPNLIQKWLLDNPHRVLLTLAPNPGLSAQMIQAEKQKLQAVKDQLNPQQAQQIIEFNESLKARQNQVEDSEVLPKISLKDVKQNIDEPKPQIKSDNKTGYVVKSNGLAYVSALIDLAPFNAQERALLPWLSLLLTELGSGQRDYLQTQMQIARYTGGISANVNVIKALHNPEQNWSRFVLSVKGLNRNISPMLELMQDVLSQPRFDETARMQELFARWRFEAEQSVARKGHLLAMNAAACGFNGMAQLHYQWYGLKGVQNLLTHHDRLADESNMTAFTQSLQSMYEKISAKQPHWLLLSDEAGLSPLHQTVDKMIGAGQTNDQRRQFIEALPAQAVQVAWSFPTQVNYCAQAYPAVSANHPDAPVFSVMANFLRNGFLHTAIREQGGAYGGGAAYDHISESFRFFSYRDPRLHETLADFEQSITWLLEHKHQSNQLEEAILNVMSKIDAPLSSMGEANKAFFGQSDGCDLNWRKAYRESVLNVQLKDILRVAQQYLLVPPATAVLCSKETADRLEKTGYTHERFNQGVN